MQEQYYDYDKAVEYIEEIPRFTEKHPLSHTAAYLEALLVEMGKFKIIHVAGTNGKGSVCAMLTGVLMGAGNQVGLFSSPHLISINERIQMNRVSVSDQEFLEAFLKVKNVTEQMKEKGLTHPSYFEFLFLMAMTVFDQKAPDYLLLETGLGGRLDATNCITSPVLTILTSIGFDHMEYLGNTLEEIAGEKAGIIKPGVPVIYWASEETVRRVVEEKAKQVNGGETTSAGQKDGPLNGREEAWTLPVSENDYKIVAKTDKGIDFLVKNGYYSNVSFTVPFISEYQVKNAMLVLMALKKLGEELFDTEKIRESLLSVRWAGRMEEVRPGIILDGAHNGPGIDEFIKTFQEYRCEGRKLLLYAVVKDKDDDYMVRQISGTNVAKVYVTQLSGERALEASKIREDFIRNHCTAEIEVIKEVEKAFNKAVNDRKEGDVLFCAGSLYLIGALKKLLEKAG